MCTGELSRKPIQILGGGERGGVELLLAAGINSGGVDRLARFQNFSFFT